MYKLNSVDILIASPRNIEGSILERLLNNEPDITVSGLVYSPADLQAQAEVKQSNLVLVEWNLLGESATEIIQTLHLVPVLPSVIVYGRQQDWAQEALAAGADAYFWEGQGPKALLTLARKLWSDSRYEI